MLLRKARKNGITAWNKNRYKVKPKICRG